MCVVLIRNESCLWKVRLVINLLWHKQKSNFVMTQNYKEIAVFPSLSCHKAELTPKKAGLLGPLINNSRSRYQSQPYPSLLCTVPTDMTSLYLCQNKKANPRNIKYIPPVIFFAFPWSKTIFLFLS